MDLLCMVGLLVRFFPMFGVEFFLTSFRMMRLSVSNNTKKEASIAVRVTTGTLNKDLFRKRKAKKPPKKLFQENCFSLLSD